MRRAKSRIGRRHLGCRGCDAIGMSDVEIRRLDVALGREFVLEDRNEFVKARLLVSRVDRGGLHGRSGRIGADGFGPGYSRAAAWQSTSARFGRSKAAWWKG